MAAVTSAVLVVSLSACGSSGPAGKQSSGKSSSAASTKAVTVDVKNFSFNPQKLTVKVGTKVTWKFEDSAQHTATADNGTFKSPALNDGKSWSYTFNTPGTYNYVCSIHNYMTATITVTK